MLSESKWAVRLHLVFIRGIRVVDSFYFFYFLLLTCLCCLSFAAYLC